MTTWIFQANPDRFDVDSYLAEVKDISWLVAKEAHARRMAPGDRVFLWRAKGKGRQEAGLIASAHILDTPSRRVDDPAALEFWMDPAEAGTSMRVALRVDRVAGADEILTRKTLLADSILKELPHFKMAQGTNWELTPEQASRLEELWDSGPGTEELAGRRFGDIPGVEAGAAFGDRRALAQSGIHRPLQAGICGTGVEGAESIVLSGGYEDDVDEGDLILYTGQGGNDPNTKRQVADQELTRGNLALARSKELGLPVRVIRGPDKKSAFAPKSGYRFDGLYLVVDYWHERPAHGFLVWRFRLVRFQAESLPATAPAAEGDDKAPRKERTSQAIVRSLALAERVKRLHDYCCQVCGTRLELLAGPYAEAAHIRPLGMPHNGPDTLENLLCLCPNCHKRFDGKVLTIAENLLLVGAAGILRTVRDHTISVRHIAYHREHYGEQKGDGSGED